MSVVMEFTKEQLEQIGSYIESNFDRFSTKSNVVQLRPYDVQLINLKVSVRKFLFEYSLLTAITPFAQSKTFFALCKLFFPYCKPCLSSEQTVHCSVKKKIILYN